MTVLFMYNFRSLSNKFPKIFLSLIFRISLAKETNVFGFENVMERGIRKILTLVRIRK